MSWLEVEDQEPHLGHVKLVMLMKNKMEMTGKWLVIKVWSSWVINELDISV